jgi:glycosyltransferase involved in cell wall biosynthesis
MTLLPSLSSDAPPADVTLLLEGTYPYVQGGVSHWVHQLITGLPEYRFAAIFLGSRSEFYDGIRYKLPDNLVHLETHFLLEEASATMPLPNRRLGNAAAFSINDELHQRLQCTNNQSSTLLQQATRLLMQKDGITLQDFLSSEQSWNQIRTHYERRCPEQSFLDYFWHVRNMHLPLFSLARIITNMPPTRILHSACTGFAGFAGALASQHHKLPFILSEHGIYTKERQIDLSQAEWLTSVQDAFLSAFDTKASYLQQLWIRFFEHLGAITYQAANPIISLYEGNRQRQIQDGAAARKTRIIANGIQLDKFAPLRARRPKDIPLIVGFIGRVVSIKDIKTFIHAMRIVCTQLPEAQAWIMGSEDEDTTYALECRSLVKSLNLTDKVLFLGHQSDLSSRLPKLGLTVLSSLSEAQPLSTLEGFAAGLPAVTTDVGCCRDLIEGKDAEDRSLGSAGRVVPIAHPEAMAQAILDLLTCPEHWRQAQAAAIARVERYYTQHMMLDRYRQVYKEVT